MSEDKGRKDRKLGPKERRKKHFGESAPPGGPKDKPNKLDGKPVERRDSKKRDG